MAMANKTKSAQFAPLLAGVLAAACLLSAPARAQSLWDKTFGAMNPNEKSVSATIDYSERPKLKVPQQKVLPPPASVPEPERRVQNADPTETLAKPQGDYLEKVTGPDGKVSGFQDGDDGKKKFFNFF